MHDVLDARHILADELAQRRESGYDVEGLEERINGALADHPEEDLWQLLEMLEDTPRRPQWPYDEPSRLDKIWESLPKSPQLPALMPGEEDLRSRMLAAWLGRCAGCTLGKPVEGWTREDIRRYLELAGEYPIQDYFPRLEPMPEGFEMHPSWRDAVRGNVRFMARDDDIDYTILGLRILETYGFGFEPVDVAEQWMSHMPFLATYSAERAAYRNLVYGLRPPDTASYRNPYREWIGAQIRADIWGYVSPGDPAHAASLAFKDANLSHTANGIYGEMWASALISTCFVARDMRTALEAALAYVPPRSRLAEALGHVVSLYDRGIEW
jgi:hypothetical protein